ncbi:capsid protein, partial [Enterococcus faecalis]
DGNLLQCLLEPAFAEAADDDSEGKFVGKTVKETITTENSLASYDAAVAYMTDTEIVGPFIMFASTDFYSALKNAKGVSKTFT